MLILALETSGFGGSIALLDDDQILGERVLDAQRRHAQTLIPEIHALLQNHHHQPADCELIAVSSGPGSFTGLRVGITCAKVMAYATGAQLVAVPTFSCLAVGCPDDIDRVQVIMNAQRQELFVGRFHRENASTWIETQPLRIERAAIWQEQLSLTDAVTGPSLEAIAETVAQRCRVLPAKYWQPRARWVGRLGLQYLQAGLGMSCWQLQPLYVRQSAAEEKWDATHPTVRP